MRFGSWRAIISDYLCYSDSRYFTCLLCCNKGSHCWWLVISL